ncbi:hypothetical protein niasHT_012157 [Heterodera trifolii]|uniref:Galectin domain-containing protein n=1 Tax=Heterodera trifolii TaxID=157864 RepID=A0ABD2LAK3_9BILA
MSSNLIRRHNACHHATKRVKKGTKLLGLPSGFPLMLDNVTKACLSATLGHWNVLAVVAVVVVVENTTNIPNEKCGQNWEKDGKKNGPIWHGVYLYTERTNGARHIMLELSFSSEKYNFGPNRRQISIPFFGNQSELVGYGGDALQEFDDASLGTSFIQNIQEGAFLKDFVGLWTLGRDMMSPPSAATGAQQSVVLYFYRSCSCSMEAWFTRPTDTEMPANREAISVGTADCAKTVDKMIPFEYNEKGEFAFTINGITDENAVNISVQLLQEARAGSNKLKLTIELHTYSFSIQINDTQLLGEDKKLKQFWPTNEWWNGFSGKISVKLNGQMMLLEEPSLHKITDKSEPSVYLPLVKKLPVQVVNGVSFLFRLKLHDNKEFSILLLHDRPDFHDYIGATILQMKINPKNGVNFEVFYYGKRQDSDYKAYAFKANQPYEIHIGVFETEYQVKLNGQSFENFPNKMPIWTINFMRVQGNVSLLAEPEINEPIENANVTCQRAEFTKHGLKQNDRRMLQIFAESDGFYGAFDGYRVQRFAQHYTPANQSVATMSIPPWAIDHVQIVGDVHVSDATKATALPGSWNDKKHGILYTQINANDGLLQSGESIFVRMKLKPELGSNEFRVEINLFNEALAFHDLIGKTVLNVELIDGKLTFNSYYNKQWMVQPGNNSFTFTPDLATSTTELKFEITALDKGFRIVLNGKDMDRNGKKFFYPGNIPAWAVQYIVVHNQYMDANDKPAEISCKPEKRCI